MAFQGFYENVSKPDWLNMVLQSEMTKLRGFSWLRSLHPERSTWIDLRQILSIPR